MVVVTSGVGFVPESKLFNASVIKRKVPLLSTLVAPVSQFDDELKSANSSLQDNSKSGLHSAVVSFTSMQVLSGRQQQKYLS